MLNIVFQRSSTPITDSELLSLVNAIHPVIAGGDSEDKDLALLLARMVFRIEALKEVAKLRNSATLVDKIGDIPNQVDSRLCQLVPIEPTTALLVPFIGCPTDELPEAWAAMLRIAKVQMKHGSQKGTPQ